MRFIPPSSLTNGIQDFCKMSNNISTEEIKKLNSELNLHALTLCKHVLPYGHQDGDCWCVGNLQNEPGDNIKICVSGPAAGTWNDWKNRNGRPSDLITLIMRKYDARFPWAVKQAKYVLGCVKSEDKKADRERRRLQRDLNTHFGSDLKYLRDKDDHTDLIYFNNMYETNENYQTISDTLGLSVKAIKCASDFGMLAISKDEGGNSCLSVTSSDFNVRQDIRLDGKEYQYEDGSTSKTQTFGNPCFPLKPESFEINCKKTVILIEGALNFLVACEWICQLGLQECVDPIVMLRSDRNISELFLGDFKGKDVLYFPGLSEVSGVGLCTEKNRFDQLKGVSNQFLVWDSIKFKNEYEKQAKDAIDLIDDTPQGKNRNSPLNVCNLLDWDRELKGNFQTAFKTVFYKMKYSYDAQHEGVDSDVKSKNIISEIFSPVNEQQLCQLIDEHEELSGHKVKNEAKNKAVNVESECQTSGIWGIADKISIMDYMDDIERSAVFTPWFHEGDVGYIFGSRGSGKTWFSLAMAAYISKGLDFGPWKCGHAIKTFYLDGEMEVKAIYDRLKFIGVDSDPYGNFCVLSKKEFARRGGPLLNLYSCDHQKLLSDRLIEKGYKLLFLDNVSCLFMGLQENRAEDWDRVINWLYELGSSGITVVIVHHAGRNGEMRGTSRREDAANWVINVMPNPLARGIDNSFGFTTKFTKQREGNIEKIQDWFFTKDAGSDKGKITYEQADIDKQVLMLVNDGIESNGLIARILNVGHWDVSRSVKRLCNSGAIIRHGRSLLSAGDTDE